MASRSEQDPRESEYQSLSQFKIKVDDRSVREELKRVKQFLGLKDYAVPAELTIPFLTALTQSMQVFRGTDLYAPVAFGSDFSVLLNKALTYTGNTFGVTKSFPIVMVTTIGDIREYVQNQVEYGYRPGSVSAGNLVDVQDTIYSGKIQMLQGPQIYDFLNIQRYRVR